VEWRNAHNLFGVDKIQDIDCRVPAKGVIYTTYGQEYVLNDKEEFNTIKKLLMEG